MRFMMLMIPKGYEKAEPGTMPDAQAVAAMMAYNESLQKAGVLLALDGLHPPSMGARVAFAGGRPTVIDGPFIETKEVLGGYWMIQVASRDEAIEWARRCPAGDNEVIEIRQVQELEEFPADVQQIAGRLPELQGASRAPAPTKIFVNLPVQDLPRSVAFFTKLGYRFDPRFTNEEGTCMIIDEDIYAMLLAEKRFRDFTPKPIADAKRSTECLVALSAPSREAVDDRVNGALAAGARRYKDPEDHGFMYSWGFEDLDGHIWEYLWMDPAALQA
jgi:predicted lactoylglutathione lyase